MKYIGREILNQTDVNIAWLNLKDVITKIIDYIVPVNKIKGDHIPCCSVTSLGPHVKHLNQGHVNGTSLSTTILVLSNMIFKDIPKPFKNESFKFLYKDGC